MKNKKIIKFVVGMILASQFSMGSIALATTEISLPEKTDAEITEEILDKSKITDDLNTFKEVDVHQKVEIEDSGIQKRNVNNRGIDLDIIQNSLEIRIPLGSTNEGIRSSIKRAITVTANGEYLNTDDYDIEDVKLSTTVDVISEGETIDYTVVPNDISKYNSLRVTGAPMDVYYGDSIVFETEDENRFAAVFSIDRGDGMKLMTASGKGQDNDIIDKSYGNDLYYKLDVFRKDEDADYGLIEDDMVGDVNISVRGNERKQDAMKKWDSSTQIKSGDIVRTWTANPEYNKEYSAYSENEGGPVHNGYIYYQVWGSSIIRLNLSNLEIMERTISQTASDEYLDKTVRKSFEDVPKDIWEVNFLEYPDRSKLGKTVAKIRVKEYVHYHRAFIEHTFEVPFNIIESRVTADVADEIELPVGTDIERIDPSMFVEAIYEDGKEADPENYEIKVIEEYDSSTVGESEKVMINIISKEDEHQNFVASTKITYFWGSTIGNKRVNSNDFEASISLLKDRENQPYLSANRGTGLSTGSYMTTNPRMKIFDTNDIDNPKFEVDSLKSRDAVDTMNDFQSAFLEYDDFTYGDVLVYENNIGNTKTDILSSRDEVMISEVRGYNKAYYELTQQGYYLLKLNQLEVSNQEVSLIVNENIAEISQKILAEVSVPKTIEEDRQIRLELDESSIDVKTVGTNRKAKVLVYEKLKTNNREFMTSYEVPYRVESGIEVVLKENTIPVGTPFEDINPNDYVQSVISGDKTLEPKDYTVTILKPFNTMLVGSSDTEIAVSVGGSNEVKGKTQTNILWGSSLVSLSSGGNKIDSSVSLLNRNEKPYLVANEGTGLSSSNPMNSRTTMKFYRENDDVEKYTIDNGTVNQTPKSLMDKWNRELPKLDLVYGDVITYSVNSFANASTNEKGKNTWISRNEALVREVEGYDTAYYELTKQGYHLMQLNQLEVNPNMPVVNMNTSIEEMNKTARDAMIIPKHIENPNNYRFEYASVDTKVSGKNNTKMNVYEKLSTGGEFKTTYDVQYQVNPQVTETFSDVEGTKIKDSNINNFELGKEYQVKPDNYITVGDEVYVYMGWLAADKKPGKDKPNEGIPAPVKKEDTFHYIYEKADNLINMTIPTELLFGTEENSAKISSKNYGIKNNSESVSTEVSLSEFKKEKSDIKLLSSEDENPNNQSKTARLNVTSNGTEVIKSLTEDTKNQKITTLAPKEETSIGLTGRYFGNLNDTNIVNYQMQFKFKVIPD